jgi:hypothetical protein
LEPDPLAMGSALNDERGAQSERPSILPTPSSITGGSATTSDPGTSSVVVMRGPDLQPGFVSCQPVMVASFRALSRFVARL